MNNRLGIKKESLIGTLCIAVNIAILIFGSWFITSKIKGSSFQLKERKEILEATYQNWRESNDDKSKLRDIEAGLEVINKLFLSVGQPIDFINLLEQIAQKTNNFYYIDLIPASTDKKQAASPYPYLYFRISLGGSFPNFMHFLKYLENMKYYVETETIQISQVSGQGVSVRPEWKDLPSGSVLSVITLKAFTK